MTDQIYLRFHAELNDFLPAEARHTTVLHPLNGAIAIKHLIESVGVPHPEVEQILVNGQPADFGYLLQPQDRIDVYAASVENQVSASIQLRPPLAPPVRFVVDTHLGQLARNLRLFGFDTLYRNDYDDPELADISSQEKRVLLTRDRGLLKRKIVVYGHWVRPTEPRQQLISVLRRYDLAVEICTWHRCLRCNGVLVSVPKEDVLESLETNTKRYYHTFQRCAECGQVYWQGSHVERMQAFVEGIKDLL